MRILFSFVGGPGHFEPLLPVALAAASRGHALAFACAPSMAPVVEAAGLRCLPLASGARAPRERVPLRRVDRAREERDLRDRFARRAARDRAPRLAALLEEWRPDVVVSDETDFGALVAAERAGLPFATVQVIGAGSFVRADVVGAALHELRLAHSLPPDPELGMLARYLVLSPFPARYGDPAHPPPPTLHRFRASTAAAREGMPPAVGGPSMLPDAPTVYFTLGTVFNTECGDLFTRVLAGLRELPANVVVTVGPHVDPAELGPQPPHVRVESFLPQAAVLPGCDAVVSHGGSGSVLGALAHGLPLVLIPLGADQPQNADRCEALGVAVVLDAVQLGPGDVRAALWQVLHSPVHRRSAERLRDEVAALPEPAHAVSLLERLAAEGRPLYSGR